MHNLESLADLAQARSPQPRPRGGAIMLVRELTDRDVDGTDEHPHVPAPPPAVWAALNDPAVLKACIPGCESLERSGEQRVRVVMAARVGPV